MITIHSLDRVLERTWIKNPRSAKRFLDNALRRGKRPSEFSSREYAWLIANNRCEDNVLVYNGYCVIVINNCTITLYKLPNWFGKVHYDGKTLIRHARNYYKCYNKGCFDGFDLMNNCQTV